MTPYAKDSASLSNGSLCMENADTSQIPAVDLVRFKRHPGVTDPFALHAYDVCQKLRPSLVGATQGQSRSHCHGGHGHQRAPCCSSMGAVPYQA